MKQNQTKFTCDHCSKKVLAAGDRQYAPYSKGWIHLARIVFRIDDCGSRDKSDKHFCTRKCFTSYVDETIKETNLEKNRGC